MDLKCQLIFLFNILFVIGLRLPQSSAENSSESSEKSGLVHDDNLAVESVKNEQYFPAISKSSVLNDGKPFYVDRDPETGKFDFYNIKTVGVQNNIDIDVKDFALEKQKDAKHQNLHDLLHLPVKYTSSKSVYPFISGSYANLKYQGNNNRPISSNHKNYTTHLQSVSKAPVFTPITQTTTTEKEKVTTEASTVPTTTPTTTKMTTTSLSTTTTTTVKPPPTTTTTTTPTTTEPSSEPPKKLSSKITTNRPETTVGLVKFQTNVPTTQKIIYNRTELTVQPLPIPNSMIPSGFKPKPIRPIQNRPNEGTQKITFQDSNDPSTMSLSELFNVFGKVNTENLTTNDQQAQHIPYDSNGSAIMGNKQPPITTLATSPPPTTTAPPKTTAVNNFFPVEHDHESHHHDQVVFESSPGDQYVKYDIQGTNTNLVQFKDISSINNIVIHPDQNSASFILGSKQSFSSKTPTNQMPVGSSVDVPISQAQSAYHTLKKDLATKKQEPQSPVVVNNDVRFPDDSDPSNKFNDAPIVIGNVKVQGPNPLAFTQTHPTQLASKPSTITLTPGQYTNFAEIEVPVKFSTDQVGVGIGNVNVNDIYEKVTNKHIKQEQTKRYDGPIRPPLQLKPNQPPMLGRVEPYMQQLRPPLPNVLPQIRPNAKTSHGHPPPGYNLAFPHGELPMSLNRVPLPKIGLPDGSRYPQRRISVPTQYNKYEDANRRVYNPPIPQKQLIVDPLGLKPPPIQPIQQIPQMPQRQFYNRFPSYNKPYPAALQSLSPPRGIEIKKELNASSLEPVITLQMLQSKKGVSQLNFPSPKQESPLQLESQQQPNGQQSSLYVVYPVVPTDFDPNNLNTTTTALDNNVNNGNINSFNSVSNKNENGETPVIGSEYQNTPFSVDSHFEQTPLLKLKDKRKPQPQFPYRIERPDPSAFVPTKTVGKPSSAELSPFIDRTEIADEDILYNIGERPNDGKPISSTLVRVTDRPIAIAYTPTTKRYYQPNNHYQNEYSSSNYDNRISHHSGSEEVPPYRESYEFQAPFQASINLENVAKDVQAGWSVINSPTKNPIGDYSSSSIESIETNSEEPIKRFDPNSFQPEFLTGFQPIYTSASDNSHREPLNSNNEQIVPKNKNSETKSSSSNNNDENVERERPSSSTPVPVYVKNETEKPAKEVEVTTKKEEDSISSLADLLKEFIGGDDDDSSKE